MSLASRLLVAAIALLSVSPALAQDRRVPTSPGELKLSFAPIVQRTRPRWSTSSHEDRAANPLLGRSVLPTFFGNHVPEPRAEQRSLGSGVIVTPGRDRHQQPRRRGRRPGEVALSDGREFQAEVLLKDSRTDLAVLQIESRREQLPVLELRNPTSLGSAIWCWRSAIRSASARR